MDPLHKILYLTEDESDGRFYRFVCSAQDWPAGATRPRLEQGRLQVMVIRAVGSGAYPGAEVDLSQPQATEWVDVVQPGVAQKVVRGLMDDRAPGTVFKGVWAGGSLKAWCPSRPRVTTAFGPTTPAT